MKQSAHLSLSNPNLVLSSCVPMGNVRTPVRKMRSYLTSLGAPDGGPGHANQCSTPTWQLGARKHAIAFIKPLTHSLILTHAITHTVLLLW